MHTHLPDSRSGRALLGLVLVASLALIAVAQRDLTARPDDEIWGPKWLWRVLSLNGIGAIAYLGAGRRSSVGDGSARPAAV